MKNLTEFQYGEILRLLKSTEDADCFRFEDMLIAGEKVTIIKRYVRENPSDKFIVWADKNGLIKNLV